MMEIHLTFMKIIVLIYALSIGKAMDSPDPSTRQIHEDHREEAEILHGLKSILSGEESQTVHPAAAGSAKQLLRTQTFQVGYGVQRSLHDGHKSVLDRAQTFHYAGQIIGRAGAASSSKALTMLKNLNEKDADFHTSILMSVMRRCTYELYAKEAVCLTVKVLVDWFSQLDDKQLTLLTPPRAYSYYTRRQNEVAKRHHETATRYEIGLISKNIRDDINADAVKLGKKYSNLLGGELALRIQEEIAGIAASGATEGNKLIAELKENYGKIMDNKTDEKKQQIAAFKMLCILKEMGEKVINDEEAKRALAYRQFAMNLAIHAIHLGPGKFIGKEGIQTIAQRWPLMGVPFKALKNLPKKEAEFHGSVVVPMVEICDWYFGYEFKGEKEGKEEEGSPSYTKGYENFCGGIVKKLNTFLTEWNEGKEEIGQSLTEFLNIVGNDVTDLKWEYLDYAERHTIMRATAGINGEHLETQFKETFDRLIEQIKLGNDYSIRRLAYTLLCYSIKIHMMLRKPVENKTAIESSQLAAEQYAAELAQYFEKQEALAFRQIVANLVIHSLLLDLPRGSEGRKNDIFNIALSWKNDMGAEKGESSGSGAVTV